MSARDERVNDMARTLMAAWEKAEGKPVSASYVATFADMARAALADDPAQVTLARVEAVLTSLMTISPPAFDSKREHPEFAHERCKLPNCNLRPWGLGNVSPDDLRYCAYHEGMSEAVTRIRAALVPGHNHEAGK